jgi:hypothetical protein
VSENERLIPVQTRLEAPLHEELEALARLSERSVAAEIRLAIKSWIAQETEDLEQPLVGGRS